MGIATPTAILVGTTRGAEFGILIKGGQALEAARAIDTIVLDKTGTLTRGCPEVIDVVTAADGPTREEMLALAAAAEAGSEHPLGEAIVRAGPTAGAAPETVTGFEAIPGRGVVAHVGERSVVIGNARLLAERDIETGELADRSRSLADLGRTVAWIAIDGRVAGLVGIADPTRDGAAAAVAALRELDLDVRLLTGDQEATARAVAREIGIDEVRAGVLPDDKEAEIRALQARGRRVAMVGDGINDAPALARADLGIAIGTGTDVAVAASDVTLVRPDLSSIPAAIRLARRTVRVIRQNLVWAFGYNVLGIPLAAGVLYPWTGWLLSPVFASAAMALSSISVVTNSLRLRRYSPTPGGSTNMTATPEETVLEIRGMTCMNCVRHVTKALEGVSGVGTVEVDLDTGRATVRPAGGTDLDPEALAGAVREAGYETAR
jgi:heavy metal translocating P-type ATPase